MKNLFYFVIFLHCFILLSCEEQAEQTKGDLLYTFVEEDLHFEVKTKDDYKVVIVNNPFVGGEIAEKYVLYSRDSAVPNEDNVTHFIPLPIHKVAINSTTHLGYIEAIGESAKIIAATNLDLYYSQDFRNRIKNGLVSSIGDRQINHEQLIASNCDLIFSYAIDGSGYKEVERLRKLGQKVILIAEFMERHPIGKSTWLNFFGTFFNKNVKADSIINSVTKEFVEIERKARANKEKPAVMVGLPWQGSWYVSGGESFQANYFNAANANYIWRDIKQEGGVPLTFETVVNDALTADYWLNPGSISSLSALLEKDKRFAEFNPVSKQSIYTNYKRSTVNGANDYWESGVVRADLVLKDLVAIFHPELLKESELTYYKKLSVN